MNLGKITRGQTVPIRTKFYTDKNNGILANLTGATIKFIVKKNSRDTDTDALYTKLVGSGITVLSPLTGGEIETILTAADTNVIAQNKIYVEGIAKLSDLSFVRTGIDEIEVEGNVLKVLF